MARRCCGPTIAFKEHRAPHFTPRSNPGRRPRAAQGHGATIHSYSAFYENDHKTPTGLVGYLHERGVSRVSLAGLASDFCVRYSAEDARRLRLYVFVIEDACRAIDLNGSAALTRTSLASLGIACISALATA